MGKARRSKLQRRSAALVETRRVGDEFTVRRLGHHEDDLRLEATDLLRSVGMTDRNGDLYDPRGSTVHHNLAILSAKGASHVRRAVPVVIAALQGTRVVGTVWLRSLGGGVFAALRGGLVAAITQDWLQVGVAV